MSATSTVSATATKACPKCGSTEPWGFGSWCPSCGYYPALGTTIDIKPDEAMARAAGMSNADEPIEWSKVVPAWAWALMGGVAVIAGLSFLGSSLVSEDGPDRLLWTIAQCVLGAVVLFAAQLVAYLFAATRSDKLGMFDMFMKPIEIWKPTLQLLPKGAYRVWIGSWGLAAIVCALTIVGGIDYGSMFDKKQKKKKANLVHAVVAMGRGAEEGNGPDSMEEAMNEFAGGAKPGEGNGAEGGGDEKESEEEGEEDKDEKEKDKDSKDKSKDKSKEEKDKDKKKKTDSPKAKTSRTDCVVFGYTEDKDGSLALLLLAAIPSGERSPRFVASVTAEDIGPEQRILLGQRLTALDRPSPIVKTTYKAKWLQPKLMCRVEHEGWTRDRKLKNAAFVEMLPDVGAPRPSDNKVTVK